MRTSSSIVSMLPILAALILLGKESAGAEGRPEPTPLNDADLESWSRLPAKLRIETAPGTTPKKSGTKPFARRGDDVALRVKDTRAVDVRWYLVLPDLTRNYANAAPPWEPGAYTWRGMDRIRYFQIALTELDGLKEIRPFAGDLLERALGSLGRYLGDVGASKERIAFYRADVGTFFFAADATVDGRAVRTAGACDTDERGVRDGVFRIAVRADDTYLGTLAGFYNVAGVFGSTNAQSSRHLGADCADILCAALSEWRRKPLAANQNVQQLTQNMERAAAFTMENGVPSAPIAWGRQVVAGDFIAVKYAGCRKFVHVGALYRDADGDGVLGPADLVLHAGPDPLHATSLATGMFDGEVVVLRP